MITVFLRTFIIYIILLVSMRFLGKRQIGELELSELITTFMLSELAVIPISDPDVPIAYALVPILILLSIEVILSFSVSRVAPLRKFFFGAPSILIYKGKINVKEMRKLRIGIMELLSELRLKDIADIRDVRCAILEENGKLSVFTNAETAPVTRADAGIQTAESGVALPVIVDGKIMPVSMRDADVDEAWIERTLAKNGMRRADILLMTVDEQKCAVFIRKSESESKITEGKAK